jgi:hypothetical protein
MSEDTSTLLETTCIGFIVRPRAPAPTVVGANRWSSGDA